MVKNLPASAGDAGNTSSGQSLGGEDAMANSLPSQYCQRSLHSQNEKHFYHSQYLDNPKGLGSHG